ncbi:MAG TPA: transcription termination factor Rho [Candidatus Krumholzibacteria bacterium]|nr:transcription termination factor Rho [Candidatus Krumholzibacteria bacterium]
MSPGPNGGGDSRSGGSNKKKRSRRKKSGIRRGPVDHTSAALDDDMVPPTQSSSKKRPQNSNGQRRSGGGRRRPGPARSKRSRRGGSGSGQQRLQRLFDQLHKTTSIDPEERWHLSREDGALTPRVIDMLAPLGKGQRCLIVAPPKAGKTTLLLEIARSLEVNHPEAMVFALLVDERPEEVTHFRRSCHAEVIAASSDQVAKDHVRTTEAAVEQILQPVLEGKDVVLLLDSITRLARAYNTVRGDSGRTLSGGLDANAMQTPRRLFGAARNIENGGSLTILGTALVDTGSRMDEVIFQEFKGTGNTEIVLSRQLFEKRIFPALDIAKSGTRKEEKLYDLETLELIHKVRRVLSSMPPDRAMEGLLKLLAKHATNQELLHALPRT